MTDRFKDTLNALLKCFQKGHKAPIETFGDEFVDDYYDEIREALTLATEYEQLRKERDELARIILMVEDGSDSPVDEDEWDYIVKICREAKKVSKQNG